MKSEPESSIVQKFTPFTGGNGRSSGASGLAISEKGELVATYRSANVYLFDARKYVVAALLVAYP